MSRVVQQDLEQISRNAHLEHERQGQLLALGRAGVPHHIAEALPTENEPDKRWGIGQAMKVLAGGIRRAVGGGGASDDSTSVGDTGGARSSGYAESVAVNVDPPQPTPMQMPPEDVMEKVIERVLQKVKEKMMRRLRTVWRWTKSIPHYSRRLITLSRFSRTCSIIDRIIDRCPSPCTK